MKTMIKYWNKFLNWIVPNRIEKLLTTIIKNDEELGLYGFDDETDVEKYNRLIDEAYDHYLKTHEYESFIMADEMNLTKDKFIEKIKLYYGFSHLFGVEITEEEMTWDEKVQWVMKNTDVEWENLYIVEEAHKETTPTKVITLKYKNQVVKHYE